MSTISSGLAAVCQCITASAVQNVHDDMVHVRILPPKKRVGHELLCFTCRPGFTAWSFWKRYGDPRDGEIWAAWLK